MMHEWFCPKEKYEHNRLMNCCHVVLHLKCPFDTPRWPKLNRKCWIRCFFCSWAFKWKWKKHIEENHLNFWMMCSNIFELISIDRVNCHSTKWTYLFFFFLCPKSKIHWFDGDDTSFDWLISYTWLGISRMSCIHKQNKNRNGFSNRIVVSK